MSFAFKKDKSKEQQQSTQTDNPYAPTIPLINDTLAQVKKLIPSAGQVTGAQTAAINELSTNAGNPYAADIGGVADKAFSFGSEGGTVTDAYKTLQSNLGSIASGANLNLEANPYIAKMLETVGNSTQDRINRMWAGQGRSMSAGNEQAVARGVQEAQLPILTQLYDTERSRMIDAAKTLFGAGQSTAQTVQGLNQDALGVNAGGIDASKSFMEARDAGANQTLEAEALRLGIPLGQLQAISDLLAQNAGLGGTRTGSGTATRSGTSFGLTGKLI